jgi:NAD(P)-dependent dehydrogenase (short-subunit alcohol dehydrogenase family)
MKHWASVSDIPSQTGKCYVITGANSGLGYETAKALAHRGARVLLACRNLNKGKAAVAAIQSETPNADLTLIAMDLADLSSVRASAVQIRTLAPKLDGLVNNAGLMALPKTLSKDGFEMQIGTNHLGHFALTSMLLPLVEAARGRVVTVSSFVHKKGSIQVEDLSYERRPYSKWGAYAQSKLANLLFMYELDRRLRRAGRAVMSLSAHPGYSATELAYKGPDAEGSPFMHAIMKLGYVFAQTQAQGALPQIRALTDEHAKGAEYYGPRGLFEVRGPAGLVDSTALAKDATVASALWAKSIELTGEDFGGL